MPNDARTAFEFVLKHPYLLIPIAVILLVFVLDTKHDSDNRRRHKEEIADRQQRANQLYGDIVNIDRDLLRYLHDLEVRAIRCLDWEAREKAIENYHVLQRYESNIADTDFSKMSYDEYMDFMWDYYKKFSDLYEDSKQIDVVDLQAEFAKRREKEEEKREKEKTGKNTVSIAGEIPHGLPSLKYSKYFFMCSSEKELTKRYRMLVKLNHPDSGGDQAVFIEIQKDYEECKKLVKR